MAFVIRIYIGDEIKDVALTEPEEKVSVGSNENDTVRLHFDDVLPSHFVFSFDGEKWICHNSADNVDSVVGDGNVFLVSRKNRIAITVYLSDFVAQQQRLTPGKSIAIGRSSESDFFLSDRSVSSLHAMVVYEDMDVVLKDCNSLNGTYLNGRRISEETLKDGDIIYIGRYTMIYRNCTLELCQSEALATKSEDDVNYPVFNLSPRLRHKAPSDVIEIQAPPGIGSIPMVNWLSFLPMLATGSAYSAIFPLTSVFSTFLQKRKYRKAQEVRQEKYETYLADVKNKIDKYREDHFLSLEESNHETRECLDIAVKRERTMWERTFTDDDFMKIRIGRGNIDTSFKIKFPDSTLKMYDDELEDQGEDLGRGNMTLVDAPILCDILNDLSVGIIGDREKAISLARNMIVQMTTSHSYKEVKLVSLFPKKENEQWSFVKWLPHSYSENRQYRYVANDVFNASSLEKIIDEELKGRKQGNKQENDDSEKTKANNTFYLFVVSDPELIDESEIENYLDNNYVGAGIGVIYVYDRINDLPQSCNLIIDLDGDEYQLFHKSNVGEKQSFVIDSFSLEKANQFARSMAPVRLAEKKSVSSIPSCVTFLEGYGVKTVEELPILDNWNNSNVAKAITVPLGVKANGEQFMFNIMYGNDFLKYHGPFGLVAGTNGSGKSEMMQSWILSLAAKFSPRDLSFIIIDYKGTGLLMPFKNLPHLSGKISNLDGNVKRNIIALNKEMKRRQAIFDKVGIIPQDIKEYHKKGFHNTYEPLPVIIIVIDEFAEIRKNLPEFVPVLESLFAVGRSLGIFAVVSTQKPSGVVTDKMYANSKFRWCCRVSSTADSKEMLRHPDAAKITNAGRAYVQVGEDDIYELVQSFWSGAPYDPENSDNFVQDIPVSLVDITGKRIQYETYTKDKKEASVKEIDAVVDLIEKLALDNGIEKSPKIWQDRLAERIYIDDVIDGYESDDFAVPVGMIDNPYEQAQYPLEIDFSKDGHCLVYGAPGTGKTTFLQTFIMSASKLYSPEDLNIYVMDFGSWSLSLFSKLPQVGGVANDNESEKIDKLVSMLSKELDMRKKLFAMNGIINIKSYEQTTGKKLPNIVLVVDNLNTVFNFYPNLDEFFIKLSREGASYGIYLLATSGFGSGVSFKITNNIKNTVALQLKDKSDYASVVGKTDGLEPDGFAGRGLVKEKPFAVEFQTALPATGEDDMTVLTEIKKSVEQLSENATVRAKAIPVMPERIDYASIGGKGISLGLSCESIEAVELNLEDKTHCVVVSDATKQSYCGVLNVIIKQFRDKTDSEIAIFDNGSGNLAGLMDTADRYIKTASEFDDYIEQVASVLNKRKSMSELDDEKSIVIAVDGYKNMYDAIDDKTATRLSAIVRMGRGLKVYLVVRENSDRIGSLSAVEPIIKTMVDSGYGILCGGAFKSHVAYDQSMLNYSDAGTIMGASEAYLVSKNDAGATVVKLKTMSEK